MAKSKPFKRRTTKRSKSTGGRAGAGGTRYEASYAACLAVEVLAGERIANWRDAQQIRSVTMQSGDEVDDVVFEASDDARLLVQAKGWSKSVPLSARSGLLPQVFNEFAVQFNHEAGSGIKVLWVVTPEMGAMLTSYLRKVLDDHRHHPNELALSLFEKNRYGSETKVWTLAKEAATRALRRVLKSQPSVGEVRQFLRCIQVEVFDAEKDTERAIQLIRDKIVKDTSDGQKAWACLLTTFLRANSNGLSQTPRTLRESLEKQHIRLKPLREFEKDIDKLNRISRGQVILLARHSTLPSTQSDQQGLHLPRRAELQALYSAALERSLVVVGQPGCGKSGLLHALAKRLEAESVPVITFLAEEMSLLNGMESSAVLGLDHGLDEVLFSWPSCRAGILITDALDALRDDDLGRRMRGILREILHGKSGWRVVASVREFDLKAGTELRELFSGSGVNGYRNLEFTAVSHFYLGGLRDCELVDVQTRIPGLSPFIRAAAQSHRGLGMERSLFHLRIAVELLNAGVKPGRLADLNTPTMLFDRYWVRLVEQPRQGAAARVRMVKKLCQAMVEDCRPVAILSTMDLEEAEVSALRELASAGIVSGIDPQNEHYMLSGSARFVHHIFQDFAIAKTLLPPDVEALAQMLGRHPLLPLVNLRSYMFSLEQLWESDSSREDFWMVAVQMQSHPALHGISRIVAPTLAAKRVENTSDLEPLLSLLLNDFNKREANIKTMMQLTSGLADVEDSEVASHGDAWSEFAAQLSLKLTDISDVEAPLVHILARLNPLACSAKADHWRNSAGIALLQLHLSRPVNRGWTYAAIVAIECVCRTFGIAPAESESCLLGLMAPDRLKDTPHDDMLRLAHNLKRVLPLGHTLILRSFEAAFSHEVKPGEWNDRGGLIMSMRMQVSDDWHCVQYSLAGFFQAQLHEYPQLATSIIAMLSWCDSDGTKLQERISGLNQQIGTVDLLGRRVRIVEDASHYWFGHRHRAGSDIATMMSFFRGSLATWAGTPKNRQWRVARTELAKGRHPAYLLSQLLKAGTDAPVTLGVKLRTVLHSSFVLVHCDLFYEATNLVVALHRSCNPEVKAEMEDLVLGLTAKHVGDGLAEGGRKITHERLRHAQDRLLGSLGGDSLVHPKLKRLYQQRSASNKVYDNRPPFSIECRSGDAGPPQRPRTKRAAALGDLRAFCGELSAKAGQKDFVPQVAAAWPRIRAGRKLIGAKPSPKSREGYEAWGALVGLCENIAGQIYQWKAVDRRWKFVKEVLLTAVAEPFKGSSSEDDPNADLPGHGVPFPQIDGAQGLPWLARRLGRVDAPIRGKLLQFIRCRSYPVRFSVVPSLAGLVAVDSGLMWDMIEDVLVNERILHVVEQTAKIIEDGLYRNEPRAWPALERLEQRAVEGKDEHSIRKTVAGLRLSYFVNRGDIKCWDAVNSLIQQCDEPAACDTLCSLLGWYREMLSVGDINDPKQDQRRERTWRFVHEITSVASQRLAALRAKLREMHLSGEKPADGVGKRLECLTRVIDWVAVQIYHGSGAYAHSRPTDGDPEDNLDKSKTQRFLCDATPTMQLLSDEVHPHVAYELIETLVHFLPLNPELVFGLAARSIQISSKAGLHQESLAVPVVVRLVERALADHREIFQVRQKTMPTSLKLLLDVLDLFVEAGWKEARRLTHRLEQIQA